jgi:ElaB/YqjD/DUF883 family membrane-anchored ribosome-binding protein
MEAESAPRRQWEELLGPLHPEEVELLEAATELREAREQMEQVLTYYGRTGKAPSPLFAERALSQLRKARERASRAQFAVEAIAIFEQRERER